jgi:ATP-dependent RNA helicase DeaD
MVEKAMETEDISPYLLALEPLFERFDPAEVAAAAVALLRRGGGISDEAGRDGRNSVSGAARATPPPSWAKLFIGVGERDGLRKGDLVGAITGEAGVPGDAVGRIDVKESHSLVEVHDAVARRVIQALNGTTIKGRSARVDFDRPRRDTKKPRR